MTAQAAPRTGLTGRHALTIIVGFFAVVMTVDGGFTYFALKTHPGQVSVTPYEDGLLYNQRLAQLAAQDRLGWQAAAAAEPDRVMFEVHDRDGRPVSGLAITGKLERPATEAGRVTPKFAQVAPGRYEASTRGLSGTWDLTVTASDRQGRTFLAERRLTWP